MDVGCHIQHDDRIRGEPFESNKYKLPMTSTLSESNNSYASLAASCTKFAFKIHRQLDPRSLWPNSVIPWAQDFVLEKHQTAVKDRKTNRNTENQETQLCFVLSVCSKQKLSSVNLNIGSSFPIT